jgi:hypothetical protein
MRKTLLFLFILISLNSYSFKQIVINAKANSMVYSKVTDKLYASISATDMTYGNELLVINPYNGKIENEIYVGSEPNEIKLSSGEDYLYVVLDGTPQVVRLKLPTLTIDKYIQVNASYAKKQYFTKHMAVVTNSPKDIIISRSEGGYVQDIFLYKDGIMQKDSIGYFPAYSISVILPSSQPDIIYGYNDQSTGYDFSKLQITSTGLKLVGTYSNLISGFAIPRLINEKMYSVSGEVVDLTLTPPISVAKCLLDDSYEDVAVNDSLTRITYARVDFWQDHLIHLEHFSNKRYNLISKQDITFDGLSASFSNGKVCSLNYLRKNGLAFIDKDSYSKISQIVLYTDQTVINATDDHFAANISIYPNPVNSIFNIQGEYTRLEILNSKGQVVEKVAGVSQVDISNYTAGIYFVKIFSNSASTVFRILKN